MSEAAAVAVPETGGGPDRLVIFLVHSREGLDEGLQVVKQKCQAALRKYSNPLFKVNQVRCFGSSQLLLKASLESPFQIVRSTQ